MQSMFEKLDPHMSALKIKVNDILKVMPSGSQVCYIDYPIYENIGDLLIMQGTEEFFKSNNIHVVARYSAYNCPSKIKLPPHVIFAFQGGGNLGDLYPIPQSLRERVINTHPNHRVVILPQTIHYKDKRNTATLIESFGSHPDLHIYLRDRNSLDFVRRNIPSANAYLSPDMAHYLWPGTVPEELGKTRPLLAIMRRDEEAAPTKINQQNADVMDWWDIIHFYDHIVLKFVRGCQKYGILGKSISATLWTAYANQLIKRAYGLFRGYRQVRTSRLHGHILACLMGKPVELLDNTYGKNSSYFEEWTCSIPIVSMGNSKKEAN